MKTKFKPNIAKSRGSRASSSASSGKSAEDPAGSGSGKEKEGSIGSHSEPGECRGPGGMERLFLLTQQSHGLPLHHLSVYHEA